MADSTVEHSVLIDLLADLSVGQETTLLHVVECESCRAEVVRALSGKAEQEAALKRIGQMVATSLPDAAQRTEDYREAEALAARLTGLAPEAQAAALRDPRYHSAEFLEALLQQAAAAQPEAPSRSALLALLANLLVHLVDHRDLSPGDKIAAQVRAGNLAGSAHRLLGAWGEAERYLILTGDMLATLPEFQRITPWL